MDFVQGTSRQLSNDVCPILWRSCEKLNCCKKIQCFRFLPLVLFSLPASQLLLKMNISADGATELQRKLHFSSPVNEIFQRRKSLFYFMWIQDERCQNLSNALNPTSPNLHDRSTHQIQQVQLSLSILSLLSLSLSLSSSLAPIHFPFKVSWNLPANVN